MEAVTITMILSVMSSHYCQARGTGLDHVKSAFSALTYVTEKYDPKDVREVIVKTPGLTPLALATVTVSCPQHL